MKIIQLMTPEFHFLTWFVQLLLGAFGTVIIPNVCCEKRHSQTGTYHLSSSYCGYNQTEVCVGFFVFCNFILLIKSNITYLGISLIIYSASKANTNVYIFKVVCQRSVGKTVKQVCRKAINTTKPWMV